MIEKLIFSMLAIIIALVTHFGNAITASVERNTINIQDHEIRLVLIERLKVAENVQGFP